MYTAEQATLPDFGSGRSSHLPWVLHSAGNMLCDQCRQIAPTNHDKYNHICIARHHADFKALAESAQTGCELCQLFLSRVEHQKEDPPCSEGPKVWDGWAHWDPWHHPCKERYELPGTGGELVYYSTSSGDHYWLGTMNAGPLSLDLARSKREEAERENPVKKLKRDTSKQWTRNHHFDHDEMFQWLFTPGQITFGQEQLWITSRYEMIGYEQRDPIAFFDLTAGSVDSRGSGNYCYQGEEAQNHQQLLLLLPELWKWRCQPLGRFEFYSFHNRTSRMPTPLPYIATKPISLHANTPEAINVLNKCFLDCKNNHVRCQDKDLTIDGSPLRLIDLGLPIDFHKPRLHVCEGWRRSSELKYAILSHCWANSNVESGKILTLSTNNLSSMESGIDFNSLASSFRDAITITRTLNLRYLWIDALCIIQDSPEDWESEAAKIPRYFAQSEVCIAATLAPNAQHGIIHPRMIAKESIGLSSEAGDLGVRPIAEDVLSIVPLPDLMSPWPPARPPIANKPLNEDFRTLQERLFSKRIVHFTKQQMFWQCQTCLIGEDGQIGEDKEKDFPRHSLISRLGSRLRPRMREITAANENEHGRHPDMILSMPIEGHTGVLYSLDEALTEIGWYRILDEYTKLSTSDPLQLLPYFSGVADAVQKRTNARYLAGLWTRDGQIPYRALIWQSLKKNTRANNGSPSWSWSSIVGPITHPCLDMNRLDHPGVRIEKVPTGGNSYRQEIKYDYTDSQIDIVSNKIELATSRPFGQVRNAELVISGLVHIFTGADGYDYAAERGAEQIHLGARLALTEYLDTEEASDAVWKDKKHILVLVAEFWDNLEGYRYPNLPSSDQVRFLVLKQISGGDDLRRYMRVGTAKLANREDNGLFHIHSAYTKANGWKRETLVLV